MDTSLKNDIRTWKETLVRFLETYSGSRARTFLSVDPLAAEGLDRFLKMAVAGKMLRGFQVLLGYGLFSGSEPDSGVVSVASAMEVFETSILIHDDIMDRDGIRRGQKSMFAQYRDKFTDEQIPDAPHYGNALAICVGDMGVQLGYDILAGVSLDPVASGMVNRIFAENIAVTCAAQMMDVYHAASPAVPSEDTILEILKLKTGRYSCSLPLMAGATLAGADTGSLDRIREIGETMGIMYQMKDDELGIFGDPEVTGKPSGADIREGKRTLYWHYLMRNSTSPEREAYGHIFGNPGITAEDIEIIRSAIRAKGVTETINAKTRSLSERLDGQIEALGARTPGKQRLTEFAGFIIGRNA